LLPITQSSKQIYNLGYSAGTTLIDLDKVMLQDVKLVGIDNSMVVVCLTLQFIRPLYQEEILKQVYRNMNESSCLILIEKVLGGDSIFNR
jgi:hypothetical protein